MRLGWGLATTEVDAHSQLLDEMLFFVTFAKAIKTLRLMSSIAGFSPKYLCFYPLILTYNFYNCTVTQGGYFPIISRDIVSDKGTL